MNPLDIEDLISVNEAARVRGVTHSAIQDLLRREKLSAQVIGGRKYLSRKEVEAFEPQPLGRPARDKEPKKVSNK